MKIDDKSLNFLKRAIQCRELGDYGKAQRYLDKIIETYPENYLLWYEKSKLPIVQEDTVTIKNRSLSLTAYQQLSLPDKSNYLQQCGFEITELPEIEGCLSVPNLVAKQRTKYLKMAIGYAPENEKSVYLTELKTITDISIARGKNDIKAVILIGIIALLASLSTVFVLNAFFNASFFRMPMNWVIVLLIPYTLSVVGMVSYTKAKNSGNYTVFGLVCNLVALVISNLSIVNTIILFFSLKNKGL